MNKPEKIPQRSSTNPIVSSNMAEVATPAKNQVDSTNFTGAYAVQNWTENTSATVASLWNLSQLPQAIILNTDPSWAVSTDWMTIIVAATGLIEFDWACSVVDGTDNPCYYSVNGAQVQLNSSASSGTASFYANLGDTIAISCGSSDGTLTSLTISNFTAPVPNVSTDFTGAYAVENWTENTSATVASLWNLSQLPQAIILNTDPTWVLSTDWMTVNVAATGFIGFDWTCSADNGAQNPCCYSVNGVQTQLNSTASSGTANVFVNLGDELSISCGSSVAGIASLTISNFTAPLPNVSTDFTGAYAVENWTENTSAPAASLWDLSQIPQAIILNTDPSWAVSTDWMTIAVTAAGLISFDWACSSGDGTQNPCFYNVNEVKVQLNSSASSGTASVFVQPGDAFSISCGSSDAVLNSLTISNFEVYSQ